MLTLSVDGVSHNGSKCTQMWSDYILIKAVYRVEWRKRDSTVVGEKRVATGYHLVSFHNQHFQVSINCQISCSSR